MTDQYTRRLALLGQEQHRGLLDQGLRGIERETLRVDSNGRLALTPHPRSLGAALTQPQITTDYSESLLEFITPAEHDIGTALDKLDAIHRFVYSKLGDELLWSQSMPASLPADQQIPIAWYGVSHIGMLKHVYRRGLALRYGKRMQCIAGIHYNYSLAEGVWPALQQDEGAVGTATHFQSENYIALVRNFHRYSWLLMYLFGASPALSKCFLGGRDHRLDQLDKDTLYLPYATSLRMSDLGYTSEAQARLAPQFNSLDSYIKSLARAVSQPYPPYAEIGTHRNGEWVQINTNILQIENEYYSTIRPKRVINTGERPIQMLSAHGVQYIEVRCLDINPFEPMGINLEISRFLDAFLLFCALDDSPLTSDEESLENTENFSRAVREGRRPGLQLRHDGNPVSLQTWGSELLQRIAPAAALLDAQRSDGAHAVSLAQQQLKLKSPELTPSARVLAILQKNKESLASFALRQSKLHAAHFLAHPPTPEERNYFSSMAAKSLSEQENLERSQTGSFDTFVAAYRASAL